MPVNRAGRLLGRRVLAAVGVVFACAFVFTATAVAETFTVNTVADEVDADVGNEFCETAAGKCTLRAALEEANSSTGEDAIGFEGEVFEGGDDSVIELTEALPAITAPLSLSGGRCETEAGAKGPCVEVDGVAGAPTLNLEGAEGVEVEGLALTNSEAGIVTEASPVLKVRGSWFGVGLDGMAAGNELGIELGPSSDRSRIGFEDPEARNVFVNSTGAALTIFGSSNVSVLGNEFGVEPGGNQVAANGMNIVIESTAGGADAVGNTIGTRMTTAAAASPTCDLGCNLVSGSGSNGIDLSGNGAGDPAIETTIVGNHIGLDRAGTGSIPNAGAGILVGAAPETMIGGPRGGDANRIAGGSTAVLAGPGAPYLVVQRTLIGSRAAAMGSLEPPDEGIVVDSEGLSALAEEALVLGNEIGLNGGTGISQKGVGATIFGNEISGATTGIRVSNGEFGNLIEGNAITASRDTGILVKSSFNDIVGNEVIDAGNAGIRIQEAPSEEVKGNVVGGDTAAAENLISDSGNAIEIADTEASLNEVARNRGSGNAGLFIDLITVGLENAGPNRGILPPPIAVISETGAGGFAEPGATVRVFRKAAAGPGEIASFLGRATADDDGDWSLGFPAPLPSGTAIAATQTKEGGTSELEIATVPVSGGGQQPPAADVPVDRKRPRTRMLRQSRRVPEGGVARFAFTSNEPGSHFQCSLDGRGFQACRSPKKYRKLKPGKHLFRVRAIDPAGNVDRTPVRRRFEVLG